MFGSSARKPLIASFEPMLRAFKASVAETQEAPDRDTALMFIGWLQFAMAYLAQNRRLTESDYFPIVGAATAAIYAVIPDHGLPPTFMDDAKASVQVALNQLRPGDHVLLWIRTYYASQDVTVDEAVFMGAVGRECSAVLAR